jgi:DNA-directed RNA polymerase subunit E"
MVTKQKACKICKTLYEGDKCPSCGSSEYVENWKGRLIVLKPEESDIAKKVNITKPGSYAIKTK